MSDLLQTIKDQIANEKGFASWGKACLKIDADITMWPEVCKRYALEVAKASLKKASENATCEYDRSINITYINRSSIYNESNIVI